MTAILSLQAFVFLDGGVVALGANVLNMAIAGVVAVTCRTTSGPAAAGVLRRRRAFGAGERAAGPYRTAGFGRAAAAAGSGGYPGSVRDECPGGGAITAAVLEGIYRLNAGFIRPAQGMRPRTLAVVGLAAALLAAVGSSWPRRIRTESSSFCITLRVAGCAVVPENGRGPGGRGGDLRSHRARGRLIARRRTA